MKSNPGAHGCEMQRRKLVIVLLSHHFFVTCQQCEVLHVALLNNQMFFCDIFRFFHIILQRKMIDTMQRQDMALELIRS